MRKGIYMKNIMKALLKGCLLITVFGIITLNAAPSNNAKKTQASNQRAQNPQASKATQKTKANQKQNPQATQAQSNKNNNSSNAKATANPKAKEKPNSAEQAKVQVYYSKPKSGIFLGVGVGASVITRNADITTSGSSQSGDMSLGLGVNWEAKLGWRQYFTAKQGFRIYASYDQTWGFPGQLHTLGLKGLKREYVFIDRILLNADYLLDLLAEGNRRVSVYAGVFAGYAESDQVYKQVGETNQKNQANNLCSNGGKNYNTGYVAGFNAGISITLIRRHTFEIGAKVPMLDITSQEYYETKPVGGTLNLAETSWRVPTFSFGYIFVF